MKKIYITLLLASLFSYISAQQVSTLYFLDNAPMRHYLNPSYQPLSNVYISLPVIGYTDFGAGNNSIAIKDLVYKNPAGQTISFLHPTGDKMKFLNALRPTINTNISSRINLLSTGWRWKESYWHIDANLRVNGLIGLPSDLMSFLLVGMDDMTANHSINLKKMGVDVNTYAELGVGYSRILNDKFTVGGKVKYLYGIANAALKNSKLNFNASMDEWSYEGAGAAYMSSNFIDYPATISDFSDMAVKSEIVSSYFKPAGSGFAVDLGATYKPIEMLTLSLSVTDLGFISWKGKKYDYKLNGKYSGIGTLTYDDLTSDALTDTIVDRLKKSYENSFQDNSVSDGYSLMVSPRINVGAEANFWKNRIGVGLHSMTQFVGSRIQQEITLGANFRPVNYFNFATSYSFLNGRFSSIGLGLGLRSGPLHWTLAADYIPLSYANYATDFGLNLPIPYTAKIPIPYTVKGMNVGIGVTFVFGNRQDKDKDGVKDRFDLCPETPREAEVDENGCPLDADGDSVPDYLDKCDFTPQEAYGQIDAYGCPLDTDGDSVPDYLDECEFTPEAAYNQVDDNGCPLDTDGDSVPDYLDKCSTPVQAIGFVDSVGCPLDSDEDGVPDYLDRCSGTPKEASGQIDENGCPLDSDRDGVPNYLDKCPNTLPEAVKFVNSEGCDSDKDADGVPDYKDMCILTPGTLANNGCPEVKTEVRKLFTKALQGIGFAPGKSVIKSSSYMILNDIAKVFIENPTYNIEIQGHTDNSGSASSNKILSEKRANAVLNYLVKKGVDKERMTAVGYGEEKPVMSNKTSMGRYKNRRVEFIVSFEEVTLE